MDLYLNKKIRVQIWYGGVEAPQHGTLDNVHEDMKSLNYDEYVVRVGARVGGGFDKLSMTTNKGKVIERGK